MQRVRPRGYVSRVEEKAHRGTCHEITYAGHLDAEQSFHLNDDLLAMAESLASHPMIDYATVEDKSLSFRGMATQTWRRFNHSALWLETLEIYLVVTRVIWFNDGRFRHPKINLLECQVFDASWKEVQNYTVHWEGKDIIFPRVLDITAPMKPGGDVFGPEDPRIILEEGSWPGHIAEPGHRF